MHQDLPQACPNSDAQHASVPAPRRAAPRVAAVVLAAGFSSRMGSLKPLLQLGSTSAVERVVRSLREAGVAEIVVVTGHEAGSVAPLLERLRVKRAHNAGYADGMFSSVRTGVAALAADMDAFLVLPVDCPLVTARALRLLLDHFGDEAGASGAHATPPGVLYPTCLGHRGHPPLIAARHAPALLAAPPDGDLRTFLAGLEPVAAEVDVRDLTVLLDMDTPRDHAVLAHFAAALDAAGAGEQESSLSEEDALFLLAAAGTPANIVRHCRTAAAVGDKLAAELVPHVPSLDVDLVRAGCLLHDVARLLPHHATLAAELLSNLGFPRLGGVVGEHMVIDPRLPRAQSISEAELVYLADKTVADGEVVGLDERQARTVRKMRPDPQTTAQIAGRIGEARLIAAKVTAALGRPMECALKEVVIPAEARVDELRVYLVRHAQAEGPAGKRFHGQEDCALGSAGEEQADRLAAKLMRLTGGACFDAVYSSDLQRARRTAEIAGYGCGTSVQTLPWLREIDVGEWEGLTGDEARDLHPAEHAARERDLTGMPFPGGESFADLHERVTPAFDRLLRDCLAAGQRRVLIVAHRGVNRVVLAHLRGLRLEELFSIEQDYCSVTLLRVGLAEDGALITLCH
jgi:molybdenum cofactor cytidylyltransferase